jgi:hypothetical protein
MDMVRAQLGDEAFDRAYAMGSSMTSEEATAYGFEEEIGETITLYAS